MRLPFVVVSLSLVFFLTGCGAYRGTPDPVVSKRDAEWMAKVAPGERDMIYARYLINYKTDEQPGTIIVDTPKRFLYFVLPNGKAMRYGVAVGDEAYGWSGVAYIARKAEWPNWTPTAAMMQRWPHVRPTTGGPHNPLGARALYLYQGNRDTLYRIHGTNDPSDIGQALSSGCIRMRNIDVIDLYNRASLNAKVIVR